MDPLLELARLLAALAAGVLGSMVGLGGGVFIVPIFSTFLGVPLKAAIAASAVSVIVNSLSGASVYLRDHITNVRLGLLLEMSTVIGAIAGGLLAVVMTPTLLQAVFAVLLAAMSLAMLRRPGTAERDEGASALDHLGLGATYPDPALGEPVTYTPRRVGLGMAAGSVAGVVSGLLGIGGGAIKVPVMNLVMRIPVKAASATSVFMVGITVVASAVIYYVNDLIDPSVVVPATVGVLLGAQIGSRLARRVTSAVIVRILVVVLLYLAVTLLLEALGINVPGAGP